MRRLIFECILAAFIPLLASCVKGDLDGKKDESASLSISFEVPEYSGDISVKGIEDGIDPTGWTDAEKLKDGRIMDKLFVGLIDSDGDLVAYRLIHKDASGLGADNGFIPDGETSVNIEAIYGREALLTFDYLSPLREAEKLKAEQYTVFALANYSGYTEVEDLIDGIVGSFDNSNGIPGFKASDKWSSLTGFSHTPADGVYGGERMPLSLIQNLTLAPGDNSVSLKLIRQFARIRFQVRNYSDQPLSVESIELNSFFSQASSQLMFNPDAHDYNTTYVSPDVKSSSAIVPFNPAEVTGIGSRETKVLFDGYINESRHADPYAYNLHLKYTDETTVIEVKSDIVVNNLNGLINQYNAGYSHYLIRHWEKENRFIKENVPDEISYIPSESIKWANSKEKGADHLIISKMSGETINDVKLVLESGDYSHLWRLSRVGEAAFVISNQASGRYLFDAKDPAYTLKDNSTTILIDSQNGILFQNSLLSGQYMNFSSGMNADDIGIYNNKTDKGSQFAMIPVLVKIAPNVSKEIVLKTIDPVTAVVSQTDEIKRNDYINVLIEVYYNEDSNQLNFKVVKDWTPYFGDVEYN